MNNIILTTQDGLKLNADYYPAQSDRAVILLHQARRDKSSMTFLAERLNNEGFHVLSVDLRGHGQSQGDVSKFTEKDYQNMFYDAMAADEYLHGLNPLMNVQMVGSSIGANTALRFQEMNTLKSVVAISPGLNYHGINPTDANLGNIAVPIFYINSSGDNNAEDTKTLYDQSSLSENDKKLIIYPSPGDTFSHGIDILTAHPQAIEDVVAWLKQH